MTKTRYYYNFETQNVINLTFAHTSWKYLLTNSSTFLGEEGYCTQQTGLVETLHRESLSIV